MECFDGNLTNLPDQLRNNFCYTAEKIPVFTKKLWGNVRSTFEKLQVWRNCLEISWNFEKIWKSSETVSGKYWKSFQKRAQQANKQAAKKLKNLAFIGFQKFWENSWDILK